MPSAYLTRLREQYEQIRGEVEGMTNLAVAENRDLTEAELATVTQQSARAATLAGQIESLTAFEARAAAVAAHQSPGPPPEGAGGASPHAPPAAGNPVDGAAGVDDATRGAQPLGTDGQRTSSTTTQDRDPGHYRKAGAHSFFADMVRAKEGDDTAATRLAEHQRALSTGVAGAGLVPPKWLTDEFESLARQGRIVSAGVRRIDLAGDPRPMTLPRQTAGTDAVVAEQATENTHPAETDAYATAVDTVVPKPTSGIQVVSRQMIDMASPAADQLIYGDMLAVYNRKVEDKVTAALVTAAGAAVTTFATEAAFGATNGSAAADAVIDAAFAVWNARKLPATAIAMRVSRWGRFNKFRDTTGRKIYPTSDAGPMNVDGVGSVQAAGNVEGLPVLPTDGLGIGGASYPENILVYRASDTILFEGDVQRFRFEEVAGPESVKLGIWAYTAVIVRQAANSVRRIVITAA